MSAPKPKTHNTVYAKIKPGERWVLSSGDIIENIGTHNVRLRVLKPVVLKDQNEADKKAV